MKIVVLDGYTENPGDLSWEKLGRLGELTVYDQIAARSSPASPTHKSSAQTKPLSPGRRWKPAGIYNLSTYWQPVSMLSM